MNAAHKRPTEIENLRYKIQAISHEILQESRSIAAKKGRKTQLEKELARLEAMERFK